MHFRRPSVACGSAGYVVTDAMISRDTETGVRELTRRDVHDGGREDIEAEEDGRAAWAVVLRVDRDDGGDLVRGLHTLVVVLPGVRPKLHLS